MEKEESFEKLEDIFCPNCFKQSKFINGKCEFCDVDLMSKYNKNILISLAMSLSCLLIGILYLAFEMVFVSIISFIVAAIYFIVLIGSIIWKNSNIKISEKNTILKAKELQFKEIELKKKEEKQKIALKNKQEKQKLELEEQIKKYEQYKLYRKEMEEKCIEYMIQKPSILFLYKEILEAADYQYTHNFTPKDKKLNRTEKFFFTNENFKTLLFDFLIGCEKCQKNVDSENEWCNEMPIYKSKILCENQDKIGLCGGKIYKKGIITYKGYNIYDIKDYLLKIKYMRDWNDIEQYISYVQEYSNLIKVQIEFYQNTLKPFEENEELIQIYNNLKKGKCDKEYIKEKIYFIYENLYKENMDKKFSKSEIDRIIELKAIDEIPERNIETINSIQTRGQVIDFLVEKISSRNETEIVWWIINLLRCSKDMSIKNKVDIVKNIDEIIKETISKIEEKEKMEKVKKERDRLLKGDLSKEKEIEKLALSTENIKNGFEFEEYVANLYKKLGYTIEQVTKKSGDQGADVVATKKDTKYVIQAKFYNRPVGNKAVQEVVAALAMYNADKGIVITNKSFTQSAKELAKANNIELVDGRKIEEYKKQIIENI